MATDIDDHLLAYALASAAQERLRKRRRRQRKTDAPRQAAEIHLSPTQRRGLDFEDQALELLVRAGLTPLARNLRVAPGEIDLALRDGDTLVLVEVRSRANRRFGGAGASIDATKQRRLAHAAALLLPRLTRLHWQGRMPPVRFDAVLFDLGHETQWVRNAFTL